MVLAALARCSLGLVSLWLCSPPRPSIVPLTKGTPCPCQRHGAVPKAILNFLEETPCQRRFFEKIEERNSELLKLKLTTGNIVQTLNASRKLRIATVSSSSSSSRQATSFRR